MDESETAHGGEVKTGLGASVGKCGQEPTCRNLQGVSHVRVRALIIVRVPKHNSPGETRESPAAVEQSKSGGMAAGCRFRRGCIQTGPHKGRSRAARLGAIWGQGAGAEGGGRQGTSRASNDGNGN